MHTSKQAAGNGPDGRSVGSISQRPTTAEGQDDVCRSRSRCRCRSRSHSCSSAAVVNQCTMRAWGGRYESLIRSISPSDAQASKRETQSLFRPSNSHAYP